MWPRKYPYEAVWLSPSSLSDFEKCPRLYYLRNVYKNPATKRKIQLANPFMSLGTAIHRTINSISTLPKDVRFNNPLQQIFENIWQSFSGEVGGFVNEELEKSFKERGLDMIKRVEEYPGPLSNLALKIEEKIPSMWLSEKELLVLCGVIDWIEVLSDDSLHIIDFKTGKRDEEGTLQLSIYRLLVKNYFDRKASKTSFWYLQREKLPTGIDLPDTKAVVKQLIEKGKKIKSLRSQKEILCPSGGCRYCYDYELIVNGEAKHVGVDKLMNKDVYSVQDHKR